MVDSAKQTYTVDLDDTFVEALKVHAHERLGVDGGNALLVSLHTARRVERAMIRLGQPSGATREIDAALQKWWSAFSIAARYVEQGKPKQKASALAAALEALEHTDDVYYAAKLAGILKTVPPDPAVRYSETDEPDEEDVLLVAAAHQDAADMLYRLEYEDADLPAEAD